jgi:hypothetical protein
MSDNKKPQNTAEVTVYFNLLPRAAERFREACEEDLVPQLSWPTLRSLAFAATDPKTSAKGLTKSQKVMMYRRYDKLWQSIVEAVQVYGVSINAVKIQPEKEESVSDFRTRFLQSILDLESK